MGNEGVGVLRRNERVLLFVPSVHREGEAGAWTWTWPSCCRWPGEAILRTWLSCLLRQFLHLSAVGPGACATPYAGTVRMNRKELPADVKKTKLKVLGKLLTPQSGNLLLTMWHDKRQVTVLSTNQNAGSIDITRRNGTVVSKPTAVANYNRYMGGVDLCDQNMSYYPGRQRVEEVVEVLEVINNIDLKASKLSITLGSCVSLFLLCLFNMFQTSLSRRHSLLLHSQHLLCSVYFHHRLPLLCRLSPHSLHLLHNFPHRRHRRLHLHRRLQPQSLSLVAVAPSSLAPPSSLAWLGKRLCNDDDARSPAKEPRTVPHLDDDELEDTHMFAASSMSAKQFPGVSGLQDTLLGPANKFSVVTSPFVQILQNNANHWLRVASAPQGDAADVIVYDSLHNNINTDTQLMITQLLHSTHSPIKCAIDTSQRQTGVKDCGLFAIATSFCFGECPSERRYQQSKMRGHFRQCLARGELT